MRSFRGTILLTSLLSFSIPLLAQQPELILPIGHTERIFSTQYSPDGKYILTCAHDNTAKLWEASSGRLVNTFNNLAHSIGQILNVGSSTQLCSNGKYIIALTEQGSITKWEAATGKIVYSLREEGKRIEKAEYSEDGKYVLTRSRKVREGRSPGIGPSDIAAEIWDAKTGKYLYMIGYYSDFRHPLTSVTLSPGNKVFLQCYDSTLSLCNLETGRTIRTLASVENYASSNFTPDGKYVSIYPKWSNTIRLWNTSTGRLSRTKVLEEAISTPSGKLLLGKAFFSPDGRYLVSSSANRVQVYDVLKGAVVYELGRDPSGLTSPHFSAGGKYLYVSRNSSPEWGDQYVGTTTIWETKTGRALYSLEGSGYLTFSPGDDYIATQWRRTEIRDAASGKLRSSLNAPLSNLRFSPDGRTLALTKGTVVEIFNFALKDFLFSLRGHSRVVVSAEFSPNGKYLLTTSNEDNAKLWEIGKGRILRTFQTLPIVTTASFSPDGRYVVTKTQDSSSAWETETGARLSFDRTVNSVRFTKDGRYGITSSSDTAASIWELAKGRPIGTLPRSFDASDATFSPDGDYVVVQTEGGAATGWEWNNGNPKLLYRLQTDRHKFESCQFSHDGTYVLTVSAKGTAELWDTKTGRHLGTVGWEHEKSQTEFGISYLSGEQYRNTWQNHFDHFSLDDKYIAVGEPEEDYVVIWDIADIKTIRPVDTLHAHARTITSGMFWQNKDGKEHLITLSAQNLITVWETGYREGKKSKAVYTAPGHGFSISRRGSWLLILDNVQMLVYDLSNLHLLYKTIAIDENDCCTQLPDGLTYAATRNAAKVLSFRFDDRIFTFDQFDLRFNHPDKVLQALSCSDTALIRAYQNAYYRRIKRAGFSEGELAGNIHQPTLELLNRRQIPDIVNNPTISAHFKALDDQYSLDRYYVYINEVPMRGIKGVSLEAGKVGTIDKTVQVSLSIGLNKVQISCMNAKGVESLKETFHITYQPTGRQPDPRLYFVGIGASDYKDNRMNLHYAAKDIRDLAGEFRKKYPMCEVDTLIDADATLERVRVLRKRLKQTSIEDKVIVSISGHGLLDDSLNFYFATYDVDFANPSQKGLSYESLESLLDDIPARRKLLLIDACHSGEVDKEAGRNALTDKSTAALRVYSPLKGVVSEGKERSVGLENSFDLMNELFADVGRSNGTVVISAAGGLEYALEDSRFNNGVFTYCVKMGLLEGAADKDGKNGITVNELKEYVSKKVEEVTNGRQRPTTRKENIESDWRVW